MIFKIYMEEHRFFCNDEWIEAGNLKAGDLLHLKGGHYTTVISIAVLPHYEKVYNFDIADNENYYVTEDGILVHNGYKGVHQVSRSEYPNHTKMLENAQASGHSLQNLERGAGKKAAKKNRYESQKDIRKQKGGSSDGNDYDEFPYASTRQGGKGAHVEEVPSAENQDAGRKLGEFYRKNDVKEGDTYDIEIID